ncbi:unnamed protein product [Arabidopsis lyrata]|uniref:Uncharacterized protein n=1 Tax=Arabidopsis lyrata subsp. lyrata TaxID=81972 RepID=D7LQN1_ARALL|nr:hypothetical protein ARALYDRAFT_904682 [Arabidopsis lyrata subsp. lyrata]CAH8266667.1 unnamed protein product [Arabidopsis lyrata]
MIAWCWFFPPSCFFTMGAKSLTGKTFNTVIFFGEKLIRLQDLNVDPHKALSVLLQFLPSSLFSLRPGS